MTRIAAVLAAVLTLACAAVALAVTPPAGTPDLAAMTVQSSDLQPGAVISTDAYLTPATGFVADYERDFRLAQTAPRGMPFSLQTLVQLASSSDFARRVIALERVEFGSKAGHRAVERAIVRAAGGAVKAKDVHFGKVARIAPGSGSFEERVTLRLGVRTESAEIIEVGVGPVIGLLVAVVPGARVPAALSLAVARDVARNTAGVLAGATGPSGATGATGGTGATGTTGATGAT